MEMKILILDSDDVFRSRLAERLRHENQRVSETALEAEASEILQRDNTDVVLLGSVGSHQNRLSFLKLIRKIRPLTEVILITTAENHSFQGAIQAMRMGAFDDLLLPMDINAILDRIREAFKRKRTRMRAQKAENDMPV